MNREFGSSVFYWGCIKIRCFCWDSILATIIAYKHEYPVAAEVDVCVCGGGPAGAAAAIAAARAGAKTMVIDQHGFLGGVWTAGYVCWILDHDNKPGIMKEILSKLADNDGLACPDGRRTNAFDVEKMKFVLDTLCAEAQVALRLYTRISGAIVNESKRVTHVLLESKSGKEAIAAKCFVDCTGDGDVGAFAGCRFDIGRENDGLQQPMSLLAYISGLNPQEVKPYFNYRENDQTWIAPKGRLKKEMERAGHSPSYAVPTLWWVRNDLFAIMTNHEYGVSGLSGEDLTKATIHARRELHSLIDGLKTLGGIWKNVGIVATASHIGVRESRRIHGHYMVTKEDIIEGRRHDDAACRASFCIDVHAPDPSKGKGLEPQAAKVKPYDIPVRCLIAKDVDALMMAGRCISGDFLAHSSYRVTGNAVALGEAAGKVAAYAALKGCLPQEVDSRKVLC
jgi:ribulose 1,5-bisphosphate synthetase/thiazole synthase